MSLQPTADKIDRTTTAPFLLRLFHRHSRPFAPSEFSVAPPTDTTGVTDYSSLLPSSIRSNSVQIYTWPTCTLSELTGLLGSVIAPGDDASGSGISAGTRVVYKLVFADTRAQVGERGEGRWLDKPLGSVVIGSPGDERNDMNDDEGTKSSGMTGDADKTLADARFVIGDYVVASLYPPDRDGRVAPLPASATAYPPRRERDPYNSRPPPNGYGGGGYGGRNGGGGYRGGGGRNGGGGLGAAPPPGDWRRGERLPPGGREGGGGGGGYGGRGRGRPY